jgi:LysM repeat protein
VSPGGIQDNQTEPISPGGSYTVKEGDTLSSIAPMFGSTVDKLASDNNISDPDHIEIGQQLNTGGQDNITMDNTGGDIGGDSIMNIGSSIGETDFGTTHTVSEGETLSGIAAEFGTSVG